MKISEKETVINGKKFTSTVIDTKHEDIHGANLCDQMVFPVQPENLLQTLIQGFLLYTKTKRIKTPEA
jgi:hypothetical protein